MRDETSYRIIAPYYDWIMAHVDYDAWGRYLGKLWRKFGLEPKMILELGAGTCPFARREVYPATAKVIYSDLSPFMLSQAQDVLGQGQGQGSRRIAANALALPFRGPFNLCVMIYDAVNYLMEEDDLGQCLKEAYRVLEKGGLFIFDITTEENSRRHFHQAVDFGELEGCTYYRESSFDSDAQIQNNDFIFFIEGQKDCWRKIKESHQQRIYKILTVTILAEEAGFKVDGVFDGFTFRAGRENSERIHFVLRKP
jgi:ubiquinone/menaquinone biosynthesis C-methylase UbiE